MPTFYGNRVEGVDETLAALGDLPKATGRNVLRRALKAAAEPVAVVARSLAPVDEGDLAKSIEVTTQLTKRQARAKPKENEVEVYVGPTRAPERRVLNYASFAEFGTFDTAAHPYMRPAWDRTKGIVEIIFAQELKEHFEATAARLSRRFFKLR
jgi:HK97 gp10 family phage protein